MKYFHWSVSLLIFFLAFSLTGCVTTSTFEAKEKEASQAWDELKGARDQIQKLTADLETTKAEREEVGKKLEMAYGQIAELERMVSNQKAEIARLSEDTASKENQLNALQGTHDRLVTDLKKEIEAGEIKISQYKDLLTVNLVDKILFDSGKTQIKPRGLEVLKRVGDILKSTTDKEIRIEGHTDNVPIGPVLAAKYPTNWELSTARATVVARYFQEKVEIPPEKLAPIGYGEYRPVMSNDTPEGRTQNRRIEIILAPLSPNGRVN